MVNSQNNCWLALSSQDVPIVMKTKHLVHVMVFGVVTSNGDVLPPFISPHSLRLNIKCLEEVELSWIERVAAGNLRLAT